MIPQTTQRRRNQSTWKQELQNAQITLHAQAVSPTKETCQIPQEVTPTSEVARVNLPRTSRPYKSRLPKSK